MGYDTIRNAQVGLGHVGSYQVSGYPYITGNADMGSVGGEQNTIKFPTVTKTVTVINRAAKTIRVHFVSQSAPGARGVINGLHYITLENKGDSIDFNVKCKEMFVTSVQSNAAYEIYAQLTTIPSKCMFAITGSGATD